MPSSSPISAAFGPSPARRSPSQNSSAATSHSSVLPQAGHTGPPALSISAASTGVPIARESPVGVKVVPRSSISWLPEPSGGAGTSRW